MERSFHTLLAAASGGNFDVAITRPEAIIIPDSDYSTVVFHVNLIKLLPRIDVEQLRWRSIRSLKAGLLQFIVPRNRLQYDRRSLTDI